VEVAKRRLEIMGFDLHKCRKVFENGTAEAIRDIEENEYYGPLNFFLRANVSNSRENLRLKSG